MPLPQPRTTNDPTSAGALVSVALVLAVAAVGSLSIGAADVPDAAVVLGSASAREGSW